MIRVKSYTVSATPVYSPGARITGVPTSLEYKGNLDVDISLIATKNTYDLDSIILYRYYSGAWNAITGNVLAGVETQTYEYNYVAPDVVEDVRFKLIVIDTEGNLATAYATVDSLPEASTVETVYMGYRIESQGPTITESIIKGVLSPNQQIEIDLSNNQTSFPSVLNCNWKNEASFNLDQFTLYYMWFAVAESDAERYLYQQNIDDGSDKGIAANILYNNTFQSITVNAIPYRLYIRNLYAPQNLRFGYNSF